MRHICLILDIQYSKTKTFEDTFWLIIAARIPHGDKYNFLIHKGQTLHLQETEILNPTFTPDWMSSVVDGLIYAVWKQNSKR